LEQDQGSSGDAEEMCAILPADLILIDQAEVGFVHQCGALERMVATLAAQVAGSEIASSASRLRLL